MSSGACTVASVSYETGCVMVLMTVATAPMKKTATAIQVSMVRSIGGAPDC